MRFASLAGLLAILPLAAGAPPAAAQTLPRELFLPPKRPMAPASADSAARGFNLSAAPLPTSRFLASAAHVAASTPPRPEPARPVNAEQILAATAPIPPARPVAVASPEAEPVIIAPKPIMTASVGPIARGEPLPNSAVIERANAYFTGLGTLVADFTQVGGDGRRMGGTLYLQRPGKVRFEYDPPATLEVVADGRSVAVRDRKLATQDLYSISQTPLKFLLREKVNLGQDIAVTGISNDGGSVRINLEDRSTLGGTSRITLSFDPQVENLSEWRIVDAQGFHTMVRLNKVERGRRIDQDLFRISYDQMVGDNNR